jgi:translation elongation factor EF-Tu-like GTPase
VAGISHIDHGKTIFAAAVLCGKYNLNAAKNYKKY